MAQATAHMTGLDTNVLVRFLVQDDAAQAKVAQDLMATFTEAEPGFICREVLIELVWVLERAYALPRPDISQALDGLMEARELVIEAADRVAIAVDRYRMGGPGFADSCWGLYPTIELRRFPHVSWASLRYFGAQFNTHDKANLSWVLGSSMKVASNAH
jgi:predicted nucleic-acid-binding protein